MQINKYCFCFSTALVLLLHENGYHMKKRLIEYLFMQHCVCNLFLANAPPLPPHTHK